jgi:hypothetical protein
MEVKAFPGTPTFDQDANRTVWQEGMDLRDYFAAKALSGLLANYQIVKEHSALAKKYGDEFEIKPSWYIEAAFNMADAMMEARNGNKK